MSKFNKPLETTGCGSYEEYLKSEHWTDFKKRYFTCRNKVCHCCRNPARDLHHITYESLGRERFKDVVPVCRNCHRSIHKLVWLCDVDLSDGHKIVKDARRRP